MTLLHAIVLGIIEGLTEFIPVSSTGHLIVASHILNIPQTDFLKTFEIVIQLAALLAVVPLFLKRVVEDYKVLYKIFVAFLPTAVIGLLFYKKIKVLFDSPMVVIVSLAIGGLIMIAVEYFVRMKPVTNINSQVISYKESFVIGLFQTLAFIPGVSRSGATVVGGLLSGVSRASIVDFTFLLALPTIAAASGLDLLKANITSWSAQEFGLLAAGFVTSFICAYLSMKWLISYISKHSFVSFGIYRIIAAIVFFFILF